MKLFSSGSEAAQPVPNDAQEPLLDRQTSRQSYGSASPLVRAKNGSTSERAQSKRRRARIQSSVYADPPGECSWVLYRTKTPPNHFCVCIMPLADLLAASYRRALISYTLTVTLSSSVFLVLFGVLKIAAWPHELHPSPLREFLLAAGAWTVAFALRIPILFISTLCNTYVNAFTIMLSTFLQVLTQEGLRLAILILLQLHLERPGKHASRAFMTVVSVIIPDGNGDPTTPEPYLDWAPLPDVWDQAFTQVWWLGMGWATVDVAVGIVQGYGQLSLYRDVLARERSHAITSSPSPPPRQKRTRSNHNLPTPSIGTRSASNLRSHTAGLPQPDAGASAASQESFIRVSHTPQRMLTGDHPNGGRRTSNVGDEEHTVIVTHLRDLEAELSHLITRKQRAELEEVYGSPLPRIPIFLIALQRLDSILLSLGLTLLISSAYLRALFLPAISPDAPIPDGTGSPLAPRYKPDWEVDWRRVKDTTVPVFAMVVLIHFLLSILWIEALPRIGVHTASYVGLLVSLTTFFAGLGYWGALV